MQWSLKFHFESVIRYLYRVIHLVDVYFSSVNNLAVKLWDNKIETTIIIKTNNRQNIKLLHATSIKFLSNNCDNNSNNFIMKYIQWSIELLNLQFHSFTTFILDSILHTVLFIQLQSMDRIVWYNFINIITWREKKKRTNKPSLKW